jgi:hypothetical protein
VSQELLAQGGCTIAIVRAARWSEPAGTVALLWRGLRPICAPRPDAGR